LTTVYLIAGTFNAGGMERVLTNKVNWLAAHGHEVWVVTTDQRGRQPRFAMDGRVKTRDLAIDYDADNGRLVSKLVHYPWRQWRHRRRLERLLKEIKADIVVCMFNNDVSFVHRLHDGSRKVLEAHFSKQKKLLYGRRGLWALADRWRTWREERLVGRYDRFVVLTDEDCELWGRRANMVVIPNARTFVPWCQADLSQRRVLAVGRLDRQKDFHTLLYIWHACKRYEGWTLDIVGDGPLRTELEKLVEQLNLHDSVRLLPPTDDIVGEYLRSSVVAMTSRYEGLPMVLLEAQACGLPIVAMACPCGPRDVVHDGDDGFLVPLGDRKLFGRRLSQLMADEELRRRMGAAARRSSEVFAEERIMHRWEELFEELRG